MNAFASHVREGAHKIRGQYSLNRESPLFHIGVLSQAVVVARRDDSLRVRKKPINGIAEAWDCLVRERIREDLIADRQVLIVKLAVFMIDAEACAQHGLTTL